MTTMTQERTQDTAPAPIVTTDDVELLDRMIAVIRAAGFMPGAAREMGALRDRLAAASE